MAVLDDQMNCLVNNHCWIILEEQLAVAVVDVVVTVAAVAVVSRVLVVENVVIPIHHLIPL